MSTAGRKALPVQDPVLYQLKVTLEESRPPIWRRLLVPGDTRLSRLHRILQVAMGWQDYHLHAFTVDGQRYGVPSPEDWTPVRNERRVTVAQLIPEAGLSFLYEYDFGDSWEHEILVEQLLEPEEHVDYPLCTGGARACPPEDVGGEPGYAEFLEVIRDPEHEEHYNMLIWAGGDFDPEGFDRNRVNAALRRLR